MNILETITSFLKPKELEKNNSSVVQNQNVLIDLDDDIYPNTGSFFDHDSNTLFSAVERSNNISKQKQKIMVYRQLSLIADVSDALDEIVNETIFSPDDNSPIKIEINEENEKLVKKINEKFEKILRLLNVNKNIFQIVKRSYVDGQIIMHCAYDTKNTSNGIKSIKMIEPCMLYFDEEIKAFKYIRDGNLFLNNQHEDKITYSPEEIVRGDFGLYDGGLCLSYLEYAIKSANQLRTLEDLLIPLRFSRSISRRVFNVDIGNLPGKRGDEVMRDYQAKFKYKKFYNNETGEVTNQQHITSMVEDYWFANRSGSKGTTVDVLDETGNLGEMNDILYFQKKLYRSLKIPSNRISNNPDGDKDFSYDETRTSKEDIKFFMFISRIRQVYSSIFKEILKREVISTKIMSEEEWDSKEDLIKIFFVNENKFFEKMNLDNFTNKLNIYAIAQEYQGKLFSVNKILKDVFRLTEEEITEEFKKISEEENDPLYKRFYSNDSEGGDAKW